MFAFTDNMFFDLPSQVDIIDKLDIHAIVGKLSFTEFRLWFNDPYLDEYVYGKFENVLIYSSDPKIKFRLRQVGSYEPAVSLPVSSDEISRAVHVQFDPGVDHDETTSSSIINILADSGLTDSITLDWFIAGPFENQGTISLAERYPSNELPNILKSFKEDGQVLTFLDYAPLRITNITDEKFLGQFTVQDRLNLKPVEQVSAANHQVGFKIPKQIRRKAFIGNRHQEESLDINYQLHEALTQLDDMDILLPPTFQFFDQGLHDYVLFRENSDHQQTRTYKRSVYTVLWQDREFGIEAIQPVFSVRNEFLFYSATLNYIREAGASNPTAYNPFGQLWSLDGNLLDQIPGRTLDVVPEEYDPYLGDVS